MNIALRRVMTVDDYLAWAAAQSEQPRTELINGQVVWMTPEQLAHTRIKGFVYFELRRAVERAGVDAEVLTDGVTIPIDQHTAYEPDASVRTGPQPSGREMKIQDPVIVVEVLSPTSIHMDTSAKLIGYFKLPSVQHYLVIDPETRRLTHHSRDAGGQISSKEHASGQLQLDPPGIKIDVGALFG
jgi:Uma2 family endonuclease